MNKPLPSSEESEQCVVGSILMDTTLMSQAAETLTVEDFYSPLNRAVFSAMVELFDAQKPIDQIQIGEVLKREGLSYTSLDVVKLAHGLPYITDLAPYIETVQKKKQLRELAKACSSIGSMAMAEDEEADTVLTHAQGLINEICTRTEKKGFATIGEIGLGELDKTTKLYNREIESTGLKTGLRTLDWVTNGFQPTDLVIIAGRPSMGKAQPLDALVLAEHGYKQMGDVRVGDKVFNSEGTLSNVTGVFPQGVKDIYRVTFSDHTSAECCDDHLWEVTTRATRKADGRTVVMPLKEMRKNVILPGNRKNYLVRYPAPIQFEKKKLPLHPYVMGVLLGDGCFRNSSLGITNPELDVMGKVAELLPETDTMSFSRKFQYRVKHKKQITRPCATKQALIDLGLYGHKSNTKWIPQDYLYSDVEDRMELLRGLLDTDGYIDTKRNLIEYCSVSEQLATDVKFLALSLGGRVTMKGYTSSYRNKVGERIWCSTRYRIYISFTHDINPFFCKRKADAYQTRKRLKAKYIESIEYVRQAEAQCITVDAPDRLYITNDFILTHNSSLLGQIVMNACLLDPAVQIPIFSLEMSKEQYVQRLIGSRAEVDINRMRKGDVTLTELQRIEEATKLFAQMNMHIDDSSTINTLQMRSKLLQLKHRHGRLDAVCIDFLQRMTSTRKSEGRQQEVSAVARDLKGLAKDLGVPVIALSSMSRGAETRTDSRPKMSDLRDSGDIESEADFVGLLYRPHYYNPDADPTLAELIIDKHRNGATMTINLHFLREYTRFSDYD